LDFNNWQIQIRKGLLEIVVMNLLRNERRHGYEMVQSLKKIDGLQIREGNIYPILARLQIDGLVKSFLETSENGPPRKYFELTESGQKALEDMNRHWDKLIESLEIIRKGAER
jgi:PadR family transcriptional regulator, regulatory protein PadR